MRGPELSRKYRQRIEELADEACPTQLSITRLRGLLREFEGEVAALAAGVCKFVCDELANQLEHEALLATNKQRRDILFAAVETFDGLSFARPQSMRKGTGQLD
jgi:hypothetical protein